MPSAAFTLFADECISNKLVQILIRTLNSRGWNVDSQSVASLGFAGISDKKMLELLNPMPELVLLTRDSNIIFQNNLAYFRHKIVVLKGKMRKQYTEDEIEQMVSHILSPDGYVVVEL